MRCCLMWNHVIGQMRHRKKTLLPTFSILETSFAYEVEEQMNIYKHICIHINSQRHTNRHACTHIYVHVCEYMERERYLEI